MAASLAFLSPRCVVRAAAQGIVSRSTWKVCVMEFVKACVKMFIKISVREDVRKSQIIDSWLLCFFAMSAKYINRWNIKKYNIQSIYNFIKITQSTKYELCKLYISWKYLFRIVSSILENLVCWNVFWHFRCILYYKRLFWILDSDSVWEHTFN